MFAKAQNVQSCKDRASTGRIKFQARSVRGSLGLCFGRPSALQRVSLARLLSYFLTSEYAERAASHVGHSRSDEDIGLFHKYISFRRRIDSSSALTQSWWDWHHIPGGGSEGASITVTNTVQANPAMTDDIEMKLAW